MKRFLIVFLTGQFLLFAGCAIPFFGKTGSKPPAYVEEQDMVILDDGVNAGEIPGGDVGSAVGESSGQIGGNGAGGSAGAYPETGADHTVDSPDASDASGVSVSPDASDASGVSVSPGASDASTAGNSGGHAAKAGQTAQTPHAGDGQGADGRAPENGSGAGSETGVGSAGLNSEQEGIAGSIYFAEPRRPVTVYYQDKDGCLVPMTRWIQPQPGMARAAVSLMIDSALAREEMSYFGVYPVIPANTGILGIDIKDGIATIDFTRDILNYGNAVSERNIVASIVYTLTEFETINKVRMLINGRQHDVLKYGADIGGALGREDVAINADPSVIVPGGGKVDVYLMKQANAGFTYPVPVSVPADAWTDDMPELLVTRLMDTGGEGGLFSAMPDDACLLGITRENDTLVLDFNENFPDFRGSAGEENILKQLSYTLRQCNDVRKIRITVEGRATGLPEGGDIITEGLVVPATVNDIIDR